MTNQSSFSGTEEKSKGTVFITGSTGYIGTRLIKQLVGKGYHVVALARKGSEHKLPSGVTIVTGDPFNAATFQEYIPPNSVFVQLLGVPHPSPRKAQLFKDIDLRSAKASADAAANADVAQFVYISVALSPSSLMYAYQQVRQEAEEYCRNKKLNCTFIRPWYVLGRGHWWPIALLPVYGIAELVPSWRKKARAMGLVTIGQMTGCLAYAIEQEPAPLRVFEIKDIRYHGKLKPG